MAYIRVDQKLAIFDGQAVTFKSPANCSIVEGLRIYYPAADGTETSKTFALADAHGNNVGSIDLFAANVVVKVILDTGSSMAFVQNADTNAYLEGRFDLVEDIAREAAANAEMQAAVAADIAHEAMEAADEAARAANAAQNAANGKLSFEANASAPVVTAAMPAADNWYDICYGNGRFVAIANGSDVAAYSDDGITWTQTSMPDALDWGSVAYGAGKFVAMPTGGSAFAYSEDGVTWNAGTLPGTTPQTKVYAGGVVYANDKFVVSSNNPGYSLDGVTWVKSSNRTTSMDGYARTVYGNGKFVANSSWNTAYSEDGVTWMTGNLPASGDWYGIAFGNGVFVAIDSVDSGNGNAAYSTDGINWTAVTMPEQRGWTDICFGNGLFVTVEYGTNVGAWSTDGRSWEITTLPVSAKWVGVNYAAGKFIATTQDSTTVAISTDGVNWSTTYATPNALIQGGADVTAMVAAALGGGGLQIETGSYVGTDTYGASGANSITFSFAPKLVFMLKYEQVTMPSNCAQLFGRNSSTNTNYMLPMYLLQTSYTAGWGFANGVSNYDYGKKSEDGKTLYWYNSYGSASYQLNSSTFRYYWLAIG